MPRRLPLFPLSMVLFPGLVLPLHVFEERYRVLIRELLALPEEQRVFGVVAIRQGREVGEDGVSALHEIGCTARLRRADEHEDGRFDIVTTGSDRFALAALMDDAAPYLVGSVELLDDATGDADQAAVLDEAVRRAYVAYLAALSAAGAGELQDPELPDDPRVLSHLVAATVVLDLADRQALLAAPDATSRLRAELALLRRETKLLATFRAAPAPELARTAAHPN